MQTYLAGQHIPSGIGNGLSRRRRAAAVLELVLVLPILVMLVLAVVQFGLFFTKMQQVALASRTGVESASQVVSLSTVDGDPVPAEVIVAVTQQLETSGIDYCRIRLEHNVGGTQVALVSPTSNACDCEPTTNLNIPLPPGKYVRLSVGVPLSELMPNCMKSLGFDVSNRIMTSTTIYRYERTP